MRSLIFCFLLILLLMLPACGTADSAPEPAPIEIPTLAAPVTIEAEEVDTNTPRNGAEAEEEPNLPPTFTPAPTLPPNDDAPLSVDVDANGTPIPAGDRPTYTVQAGDTLAEIAAAFGVTTQALADANRITDIDQIEVGDVLTIP